jgi:3-oxoacyl-[acyl-carrier protein] reductase
MPRNAGPAASRRIAIVTGAGSGLGAAVARRLADDGAAVILADIDPAKLRHALSLLPGKGHLGVTTDVRSERSVAALFERAERKLGPAGILVCCAGGTRHTRDYQPDIAATALEDWIAVEALNARSAFLCVREMLRRRRKRAVANGRIVMIASTAGQRPSIAAGAAYSASKAAVLALTRVAALESAPLGITVNAVAPGPFDTPAFHKATSRQTMKRQVAGIPLRRIGRPPELAALIAYLVSADAGFVTGATFDINGGSRMA